MSELMLVFWLLVVVVGLLISALGSGLETGFYSLNPVRLRVMEHQGVKAARQLAHYVITPTAFLATLLIINNAGAKMATHAAAVLLKTRDLTEWQVVGFDALIMMPLLFVFAETLPKDLFSAHADRLVYQFVRPLVVMIRVCRWSGLLPLLIGTSGLFMRAIGIRNSNVAMNPRRYFHTLIKEGVGHGIISDDQSAIVQRILELGGRTVEDEMVSWANGITIGMNEPPMRLWELAHQTSRSRFPVVDDGGQVAGVLDVGDVLIYERDQCPPVKTLMTSFATIDAATPLREGLAKLQRESVPLAIVGTQDCPVGLVTLKDLVEPITGELASW